MCGLSGVAGSISNKEEDVASDLFYYNWLRGPDSCGVAMVPRHKNKGKPEIVKAMGAPWELWETKEYNKMMQASAHVILQHNRKATVGPKTSAMAHPFLFNHIVGAHNGTVSMSDIDKLPKGKGSLSDSRAILEAINDIGAVETMKLLPDWGTNAWALTWYDKRDHTMNMLRNADRPLFYCYDDKRENIFWSSLVEHLAAGILINGVRRPQGEKCFTLPENRMFTWKIPEWGKSFQPPKETKIEYKTWSSGYTGGASSTHPFPTTGNTGPVSQVGTGSRAPFTSLFDLKNEAERKRKASGAALKVLENATQHEQSMLASLGKNKFYLIYKDDQIRVYIDTNTGKYHRYFWSIQDADWKYHLVNGVPPELEGVNIPQTIRDKQVITNRPLADYGPKPTKEPTFDLTAEAVRWTGMRTCVTKKRDKTHNKPWNIYTWGTGNNQWNKAESTVPPPCMPNDLLDICSNHTFKWVGNKKKGTRKVQFRGWNGVGLTKDEFNKLTHKGCTCCSRTPTWVEGRFGGVSIKFWDPVNFLCQYCGEDKEMFSYLTGDSKTPIASSNEEEHDHRPSVN